MFDRPETNNALHNAILEGGLTEIISPDHLDEPSFGNTPLLLALKTGRMDVALLLVQAQANLNLPDARGLYPLHYAAMFRQDDLIREMLARGAIAPGPFSAADLYKNQWAGLAAQITKPEDCVEHAAPLSGQYSALTDIARFHIPLVATNLAGMSPNTFVASSDPLELVYLRSQSMPVAPLYLKSSSQFYFNFKQGVNSVVQFRDNIPMTAAVYEQLRSNAVEPSPITSTDTEKSEALRAIQSLLTTSLMESSVSEKETMPLLKALHDRHSPTIEDTPEDPSMGGPSTF